MDKQNQDAVATQADGILALPKEKRMEAILAMPADERRIFVTNIRGQQRDRLLADLPPDQREAFLAMTGPVGRDHQRTAAGEASARALQRAPVAGGDDGFLVQSLQCLSQ